MTNSPTLMRVLLQAWILIAFNALTIPASLAGSDDTELPAEQIEFFEAKIRPLLIEHCFECHGAGAKLLKGGLRLDSHASLLKGGDSGPAIVSGKPDESLLVQAVRWTSLEMPPRGKLSDAQIRVLTEWVTRGAPWPSAASTATVPTATTYDWAQLRSKHWAWKPAARPALPPVRNAQWTKNPIDRFVLARLDASELSPAPAANARSLVRRVYFDLIGLPPKPEVVDAFTSAFTRDADTALAELVDRLLALPQYGERWGRHWLDVARYSDLVGTFGGPAIPHAWRYRDWVVEALNRDLPYDQFLRFQVAGDLLQSDQAVATGFFALGPTYVSDGGDPDATAQALSETLDDRVDTLTRGLLGLTVSCARCHDHKFDPIPQLDYYSLAGVFHNTTIAELPLVSPEVVKAFNDHQQAVNSREQKIRELDELAKKENRQLTTAELQERDRAQQELDQLKQSAPAAYPVAHSLVETGSSDMHLAIRGNLRKPGEVAPRRFLGIVTAGPNVKFARGSGRLDLADALVAADNPLTARVLVNRVWLHHFGQGLVRTPSNLGTMGEKPTHPELLDWLAVEFQTGGAPDAATPLCPPSQPWSLKRLHKLIMMSATYRMSSRSDERALGVDADNRLLWRANPRRLDVEAWRDSLLAVTGELDRSLGGPPIDNLMSSPRRTLYGAIDRNGDHYAHQAFLGLFDFPLARATNEGRVTSVAPQQSLFLMNSPFMAARARALAARLQSEATDDEARVRRAYQLLYCRLPTDDERTLGLAFLKLPKDAAAADQLSRSEQYAQVLLSANELMYVE